MNRLALSTCIVSAVFAAACAPAARMRGTEPAHASVRVVCTASLDVGCFEAPSRLCGSNGYDLFDLQGRPATVGDARHRVLEARCRR